MTMVNTVKAEEQQNLWSLNLNGLTWTYIEKPTRREIDQLSRLYPFFHPLNLDDCLSRIQRPKIDEYDDHLFLVLHFPVFDKQTHISVPSEVDIFMGKNFLVIVHCSANLKPLSKMFKECQISDEICHSYMKQGFRLSLLPGGGQAGGWLLPNAGQDRRQH